MKNKATQTVINIYIGLLVFVGLFAALNPYLVPEPYLSPVLDFLYGKEYVAEGINKIHQHPIQDHAHRIFGSVFVLSGLLQFSDFIKKHYRRLHKITGYIFIACTVTVGVGGIIMANLFPFGGKIETYSFTFFALMVLYFVFKGWQNIRQKNFEAHQQWMMRVYMVSLTTMAMRLYAFPFLQLSDMETVDIFNLIFWLGFITNIVVAEIWVSTVKKGKRKPVKKVLQTAGE